MTKHDWFWVAVKILGLALLTYAGFMLLTILTALFGLPSGFGNMGFGKLLLAVLVNVGVTGGVGMYLIRDGSLLLDLAAERADPKAHHDSRRS